MALDTIIELKEVTIFQEENLVLKDVSLTVDKGEFVYLIGKVGSGKSSLLKSLYAEVPVTTGLVEVAGYEVHTISRKQVPYLRRKIGVVFQDFQLLTDRTVYENLRFVLRATGWKNKAEIDQRIKDALDKAGLTDQMMKMPHQLSGGEQQRVVIARALLNDPEIILADEPTGNLDPETSEGIISLLIDISKTGRAVVVATHNYTLLKKFPARTLKCDGAKIYEAGEIGTAIDFESLTE
jgi:cell division transport system ATP-binding protein